MQRETVNPRLCAALSHLQVKAAAIGIHASCLRLRRFQGRQPPHLPPHVPPSPTLLPTLQWRIVAYAGEAVAGEAVQRIDPSNILNKRNFSVSGEGWRSMANRGVAERE